MNIYKVIGVEKGQYVKDVQYFTSMDKCIGYLMGVSKETLSVEDTHRCDFIKAKNHPEILSKKILLKNEYVDFCNGRRYRVEKILVK